MRYVIGFIYFNSSYLFVVGKSSIFESGQFLFEQVDGDYWDAAMPKVPGYFDELNEITKAVYTKLCPSKDEFTNKDLYKNHIVESAWVER